MPLILLTAPAEEPLSLSDAKLFLRIDHDDEDILVAHLVSAARAHVEKMSGYRLMMQTWRLVLDAWPDDGIITLPLTPVREITEARLRARDGSAVMLDTGSWLLDSATRRIHVAETCAVLRPFAGIEIDIVFGHETADDVPTALVQAMRLLVGHWYENRAGTDKGAERLVPLAASALVTSERVMRL